MTSKATAEALGLTELQTRFALALLAGNDQTASMRIACGLPLDGTKAPASFRSKASKAANSPKVGRFLELAREAQKNGPADKPLTDVEKLQILARLARSSNPQNATRAVLAHAQLQADMNAAEKQAELDRDPVDILKELSKASPLCSVLADELARIHGLDFRSADVLALPKAAIDERAAVRRDMEGRINGSH